MTSMNEIIKKYHELISQANALISEQEIKQKILEVAKEYGAVLYEAHTLVHESCEGVPSDRNTKYVCEIIGDEILVEWHEYWSHGGRDNGTFWFPVDFLWDEVKKEAAFGKMLADAREELKERQARDLKLAEEEYIQLGKLLGKV